MCSGSKAGSYLRLIDFVYHSTLGLRTIQKKKGGVLTDKVELLRENLAGFTEKHFQESRILYHDVTCHRSI